MTCPVCHSCVGTVLGRLAEHKRYADGAGPGPDQPHDLVTCEGSGTLPR